MIRSQGVDTFQRHAIHRNDFNAVVSAKRSRMIAFTNAVFPVPGAEKCVPRRVQ
jgi:hypothetical protein